MTKDSDAKPPTVSRRTFLAGSAAGAAATMLPPGFPAPALAQAQRTARVWGEPGPYAGVFVQGMNEWAQKNAPGLKFEVETIPWDGVYVKLMTDLAARRPPALISVEHPIAYQLMAEGLLEPVDDVAKRVNAAERMVDGLKLEYYGNWKGTQYIMPGHHQAHLLLVQTDVINELGLGDPNGWSWNDLLNAAKTVTEKKPGMAGLTLALGRNLCTDYHFTALLHQAGGMTYDAQNKFEVAFDSAATVDALEFMKRLYAYMPKGAVEYSFLQVVDQHVTGKTAMSFYWGRTMGRAAEEAPAVFKTMEAFNHAKHPTTGRRSTWTDLQGWCVPKANNPYVKEVKEAIVYVQSSIDWGVRYCHSLMPNVAPVYKDVASAPQMPSHPFFKTKPKSVETYFTGYVPNASSTGNELMRGANPLAGIAHGRSMWAQVVQRVLIDNMAPAEAAKWGAKQFEEIRRENIRLVV